MQPKTEQYYVSENWAIASDGIQWILQKKSSDTGWKSITFIHTQRDILERCMRDKGVPEENRVELISSLPCTFNEWRGTHLPDYKNNAQEPL
jgi:hypothetical protein